jgi:precorrin-6B methylase 2
MAFLYDTLGSAVNRTPVSALLDYYFIRRHGAVVTVKLANTDFSPYLIRLEPKGKLQRQRARGVYESHVMEFLDSNLGSDSVFWEFGAAWGYFSLAAATRVNEVYSFEMMDERVEHLETAVRANYFHNVSVVQGMLDDETSFGDYPRPDTVLVDVEGWEYVVLQNALEQLPDVPTWIVEVHSELIDNDTEEPIRAIGDLLEDRGYFVEELNQWSENNIHLLARTKS